MYSAGYLVSSAQIFMTRDSPPVSKCCGKVVFEEGTHILDVIEQFNGYEVSSIVNTSVLIFIFTEANFQVERCS